MCLYPISTSAKSDARAASSSGGGGAPPPPPPDARGDTREFPSLLARRTAAFSYRKCSFAVGKGKECTARVVTARELGVQFSYTLEV